jgi:predicted secreted protein
VDEEEKYSSVVRQPGKYVPPGARPTPVAAGAGVKTAPVTVKKEDALPQAPIPSNVPHAAQQKPVEQKDAKAGTSRKSDILQKLPLGSTAATSSGVPEAPQGIKKEIVEEVKSKFSAFADNERKNAPHKLREHKKVEKSQLLNDLKNFSKGFKVCLLSEPYFSIYVSINFSF